LARTKLIAGNWKMNMGITDAVDLARSVADKTASNTDVEIAIFPTTLALASVSEAVQGTNVQVGAQNMHNETDGAFTGEISPTMLQSLASMVILGHSERRQIFGETNDFIALKVASAVSNNITPVVCIGETLEQREANETSNILQSQVIAALLHLKDLPAHDMVLAYEPIWAIGTGVNANPDQAESTIAAIRNFLSTRYGSSAADALRILYGGSVNPQNWEDLSSQENIDGALVGGASLKADDFAKLVKTSSSITDLEIDSLV
tara:strand:- start:189 stop:977 length:789 start_codon:yes stop_codon:yes gene_type:complete